MASTLFKVNFEPISPVELVQRRSFTPVDKTLLEPLNAAVYVDGEWVVINDDGKMLRAVDISQAAGTAATIRSYPLHVERGRYDVQSIKKAAVFYMGEYEANTRIFDSDLNGAGGFNYGDTLSVAVISFGGRKFSGLVKTASTEPVVGIVTKKPSKNGQKLRFKYAWTK